MIVQTNGSLVVRIAIRDPEWVCEEGITAERTAWRNPTDPLPEGRATLLVTSPEGWIEMEEDEIGVQHFRMTTQPLPEEFVIGEVWSG
jgi:hypothetical protein